MAAKWFDLSSSVRRYHIYQQLWNPQPGETLNCRRERNNRDDFYAVAVMNSEEVVGHISRFLSCIVLLFLRRSGCPSPYRSRNDPAAARARCDKFTYIIVVNTYVPQCR